MSTETNCEDCMFYVGNKDKHNEEGQCRFNPPVVFPNPVRKAITNEVVMTQIQFLPIVKADFGCGQWVPRPETKPALKPMEN